MSNLLPHYDAIISLGGGSQRGPSCQDLPLWVLRRLELVGHLYKNQQQKETPSSPTKIILLSAGTPHRPNFIDEASGFPILESVSAAEYLRTLHKVPTQHMWKETTSLDTIGNAYFLRSSFLDPAPRGRFKRLAIITSKFHIARTREIFDWILMVDPVKIENDLFSKEISGDDESQQQHNPKLFPFETNLFGRSTFCFGEQQQNHEKHQYDIVDYFAVSDENTMEDAELLNDRVKREEQSLVSFRNGIRAKIAPLRSDPNKSCEEFWAAVQEFVLGDHKAYCVHENMVNFPKKEVWMQAATY